MFSTTQKTLSIRVASQNKIRAKHPHRSFSSKHLIGSKPSHKSIDAVTPKLSKVTLDTGILLLRGKEYVLSKIQHESSIFRIRVPASYEDKKLQSNFLKPSSQKLPLYHSSNQLRKILPMRETRENKSMPLQEAGWDNQQRSLSACLNRYLSRKGVQQPQPQPTGPRKDL